MRFSVLLVVVLLLLAVTSVWACPIPDYVTRVVLQRNTAGHWDVYRPGNGLGIEYEWDAAEGPQLDTVNYTWNWGDGNSTTGYSAYHTYTVAGNYLVTVTAWDENIYGTEDDADVVKQFYVRVDQ